MKEIEKTDYLALSHALRTPLTEILAMAELLNNDHLSLAQKRGLRLIQQAGNKLLIIVDQVLNEVAQSQNHHFFSTSLN